MSIGAFLDVDKTLTQDFIQQDYARALGCEDKYLGIEQELQSQKIDESEFGKRIIALFAANGLTKDKARDLFNCVTLHPWTAQLLSMKGVDQYLVSSGPSYFIDVLAARFDIPENRVRRSLYTFDRDTGLISSCDAVSAGQKAQFVAEKAEAYDITIGIGDSPEFDGPFVSHCTIPLLTSKRFGYVYIADLNSAVLLIDKLSKRAAAASGSDLSDPKKLTIPQLWDSLRIDTWLFLAGMFGGAGYWLAKLFPPAGK